MAEALTVTQPELAQVFGVSVRTVQRWEDVGLAAARKDDEATGLRYDLAAAVAWRLEEEARRLAPSEGVPVKLEEARARKEVALAELREIEVAEARGELVPRSDVMALVEAPIRAVDRELKAAPPRLARTWAKRLGVTEAIAIELLEEIIEEARTALRGLAESGDEVAA